MTDEERALLMAGLLMDFPRASYADIQIALTEATATVAIVLPDVPLAKVEEIARGRL